MVGKAPWPCLSDAWVRGPKLPKSLIMKLKKEEIEHIANLARLQLTAKEKEKFSHQLSDILDWVDQLKEVDTEAVGIGLKSDLTNVWREDVIEPFSDTASLRRSFPESQDNYLQVKGVK